MKVLQEEDYLKKKINKYIQIWDHLSNPSPQIPDTVYFRLLFDYFGSDKNIQLTDLLSKF